MYTILGIEKQTLRKLTTAVLRHTQDSHCWHYHILQIHLHISVFIVDVETVIIQILQIYSLSAV